MGFLKDSMNMETGSESESLEEMYEKLFPKIGRDFVYKDDLYKILKPILKALGPAGKLVEIGLEVEATKRAVEYKANIELGLSLKNRYSDLIRIEDD